MNIIQTLSSSNNIETLKEELNFLSARNIHGIRFNLCKFSFDDMDNILKNINEAMTPYYDRFELVLDIPYPKNKARIRDYSIDNGEIKNGKDYLIIKEEAEYPKNKDYLKIEIHEFLSNLKSNSIIYFGDGEGAFKINEVNKEYLKVTAVNDFKIFKNKGITCGYVSYKKKCIELINKINIVFNRKIIITLSFLQTNDELVYLKKYANTEKMYLIPKIELVDDINNIPIIIKNSSGALLARGDMGLLNNISSLLTICRKASESIKNENKRLFAATDMMTSLEFRAFPSRSDMVDLCLMKELGCTDIVLSYHISPRIDEIIKLVKELG